MMNNVVLHYNLNEKHKKNHKMSFIPLIHRDVNVRVTRFCCNFCGRHNIFLFTVKYFSVNDLRYLFLSCLGRTSVNNI